MTADMRLELDHVVIAVPNLQQAIDNFSALGFRVEPGGSHGPTHNALCVFADGTYIEFLCVRSPLARELAKLANRLGLISMLANRRDDVMWRFLRWFGAAPGALDWCLRSDDLEGLGEQFGDLWLPPQHFSRERPDGVTARWQLASPRSLALPFFICDGGPQQQRFQPVAEDWHPNGACGIHRLTQHTPKPDEWQRLSDKDGQQPPLQRVSWHSGPGRFSLELYSRDPQLEAEGGLVLDQALCFGVPITLAPGAEPDPVL